MHGQLVAGDAGFEIGFARMASEMLTIQIGQEIEVLPLALAAQIDCHVYCRAPSFSFYACCFLWQPSAASI